jgi:hypothetical protein
MLFGDGERERQSGRESERERGRKSEREEDRARELASKHAASKGLSPAAWGLLVGKSLCQSPWQRDQSKEGHPCIACG